MVPYAWGAVTGVDIFGAAPEVPVDVRRCAPDAWQALRVEAGIPVMGAELDERTIAAEAGLLERCVSFTKGCYTGQELVARLDARGNKVARRLRGIVIEPAAAGVMLRPGTSVALGGKVVGKLTSVAWSPNLATTIALAYLHRDVNPPCAVQVGGRTIRALSRPGPWTCLSRPDWPGRGQSGSGCPDGRRQGEGGERRGGGKRESSMRSAHPSQPGAAASSPIDDDVG